MLRHCKTKFIMKKITLSILLASSFLLFSNQSKAQDEQKNFVIKTNPMSSLGSGIWLGPVIPLTAELPRLAVEYGQGHHAGMLAGGYLGWSALGSIEDEEGNQVRDLVSNRGVKIQGLYKYYVSGTAPKGFYIGPHFSYSMSKLSSKEDSDDYIIATNQIVSAALGYQFISKGGFSFDVFTGFGYQAKKWDFNGEGADLGIEEIKGYQGFKVPFVLNFGYAF
jgi:hypothetical protein